MIIFFHIRSFLISLYTVIIAIFSLVVTQLIYRGAFGITYFGTPHAIVIILLIKVSTSNVFVIADAWT